LRSSSQPLLPLLPLPLLFSSFFWGGGGKGKSGLGVVEMTREIENQFLYVSERVSE
jgi:hypothetical protein